MRVQHLDKRKYTLLEAWYLFGPLVEVWQGNSDYYKVFLTKYDTDTQKMYFQVRFGNGLHSKRYFDAKRLERKSQEFYVLSYLQGEK